MKFQALRGFRDYLPPDATKRAQVLSTVRRVAETYGFDEVETPSVESLDLFKVKSGEGIVEQTFSFTDKGGRAVTLIPENTPSIARIFAERAKATPLPVKWISFSKLWRYEEPQSGRLREFSQVSLDIFGSPGIEAEIELLSSTKAILDGIGARDRYVFKVSDRRVTEGLAHSLGVKDLNGFFKALDRYRKVPRETFLADLAGAGMEDRARTQLCDLIEGTSAAEDPEGRLETVAALPGLGEEGEKGVANLKRLFTLTLGTELSRTLSLDLTVVRGLGYYTSTVFEAFDRGESLRSLFGGGRYDRLIDLFGGGPVPACGLAIGDQILEMLLREANEWPSEGQGLDVYVASAGAGMGEVVSRMTETLRSHDLSTDHDIMGRNLSGQLKEAARRRTKFLILVAPEEQASGKVGLRNMQTGQQSAVSEAEALNLILGALREAPAGR